MLKLWNAGKMIGGRVRGMVVLSLPDEQRPGAAACALYGQPNGFTEAEYAALDTLINQRSRSLIFVGGQDAEPLLQSGLAKIRALLPP